MIAGGAYSGHAGLVAGTGSSPKDLRVYVLQRCVLQVAENSSGTRRICAVQLVSIFAFCGQPCMETEHCHHCLGRQGRGDRAGYFSVCQVVTAVLWEEEFRRLPLLMN